MVSNFITPVISKASELGVSYFEDLDPVVLLSGYSSEEIETLIRAIYRQVLGNAYVMESERLIVLESQLKLGTMSVREFVRQIALSELYRSRFFDNCPRYRAIELNFKHLLGRAPESYEEMSYHSQLLDQLGYEAEIDSYLDSDEYQNAFGEDTVPYYRGYKTQTGKKMVGFTYLFKLLRGASSSDKNLIQGNSSRLNQSLINNKAIAVVPPSNPQTYGGLTDVNKMLAELLKPKVLTSQTPQQSYQDYIAQTADYLALQGQCDEQEKEIEKLQKRIVELNSSANIGTSELSKWQSSGFAGSNLSSSVALPNQITTTNQQPDTYQSLQRRVEEQTKMIASLQAKISELQCFATIGEARLNKWRNRTFF